MSLLNYQEDFRTPGSIPSFANSRKQIRQMPKSRMKACPRPQRKHRFFDRTANFGVLAARALTDVFAINKNRLAIGDILWFFLKFPRNLKEKHRSIHNWRPTDTIKSSTNSQPRKTKGPGDPKICDRAIKLRTLWLEFLDFRHRRTYPAGQVCHDGGASDSY